jgi:hypothetical protein
VNAKPERLPIFKRQRELRPDTHSAIAIEITGLGREMALALNHIVFERQ